MADSTHDAAHPGDGPVTARIRAKLTEAFSPAILEIIDDSESHRGHGGFREGGETHFNVEIVAEAFAGMSRVEQQRRVYSVLSDELSDRVHALSLKISAP